MKSLGKQPVSVRNHLDGELKGSRSETRTVYHRALDDTYHVNWFAGGKCQIERQPDGQFVWNIHVATIRRVA